MDKNAKSSFFTPGLMGKVGNSNVCNSKKIQKTSYLLKWQVLDSFIQIFGGGVFYLGPVPRKEKYWGNFFCKIAFI